MKGLRIERARCQGSPVLRVAGQVDVLTSGFLMEKLERLAAGPTRIGLDLSAVDFIDAGSVTLLASTRKRLQQEGCTLEIQEASPHVRAVFSELGLAALLSSEDVA